MYSLYILDRARGSDTFYIIGRYLHYDYMHTWIGNIYNLNLRLTFYKRINDIKILAQEFFSALYYLDTIFDFDEVCNKEKLQWYFLIISCNNLA